MTSEDIHHAVEHALGAFDMGTDAGRRRVLLIGPDRAGNLLEVVVLELAGGQHLVIHGMRLRSSYFGLLGRDTDG